MTQKTFSNILKISILFTAQTFVVTAIAADGVNYRVALFHEYTQALKTTKVISSIKIPCAKDNSVEKLKQDMPQAEFKNSGIEFINNSKAGLCSNTEFIDYSTPAISEYIKQVKDINHPIKSPLNAFDRVIKYFGCSDSEFEKFCAGSIGGDIKNYMTVCLNAFKKSTETPCKENMAKLSPADVNAIVVHSENISKIYEENPKVKAIHEKTQDKQPEKTR